LSTKENLEYIKQELDKEEKFLESLLKAERFYKKYKKPILGALGVLGLGILGYIGYEYKVEQDLKVSNLAYLKLLQNPNDKEALETLKSKNEKLYTLYLYHQGVNNKDRKLLEEVKNKEIPILPNLALYHLKVLDKDEQGIYNYSIEPKSIFKELALVEDGYLLMKNGNIALARERLKQLPNTSLTYPLSLLLQHYGVKVEK